MPALKLTLSAKAEEKLKKKIAEAVGRKARKIVEGLHMRILARTPMNTGRTLGSWHGSAGMPVYFDIASQYGEDYFAYDPYTTINTNDMAVGAEPGRKRWEEFSIQSTKKIDFEKNPYRKYFIANGAELDSIAGSSLPQGPGSRALMLEYGTIAGYDLYYSTKDNPVFSFHPRGTLAVQMSVLSLLRDWRSL